MGRVHAPHEGGEALERVVDSSEGRVPRTTVSRREHYDGWLHLRMAGLNLRRLLNLGLVRSQGVWALA